MSSAPCGIAHTPPNCETVNKVFQAAVQMLFSKLVKEMVLICNEGDQTIFHHGMNSSASISVMHNCFSSAFISHLLSHGLLTFIPQVVVHL